MKHTLWFALALMLLPPSAEAQETPPELGFLSWQERTGFSMASPGSMKFGLYGYANPAVLPTLHQPDLLFQWSDAEGFASLDTWGLFAAAPNVGFGVVSRDIGGRSVNDYRLSVGFGDGTSASFGMGYGWYRGAHDLDSQLTLGSLFRPSRYLSVGLVGTRSFGQGEYEGVADLAVRPFGTERLALFSEVSANTVGGFGETIWSAGAAVEALPGVRLAARYVDDVGFTTGLQLTLGRSGVSSQAHMDTDAGHRFNSYGVRLGAWDRNLRDARFPARDRYLHLELRGSAPHQRARIFGREETLQEWLDALETARHDPRIAGVVVDARRMALSQGKAWEVASALGTLREEGRTVILYVERGGMNMLHFIGAADHVVMDPRGSLTIPGYHIGRTYLADLFDEVGVGVDEFRELEYKSGWEPLSRSEMSEAAREQNQVLVDGLYFQIRENVGERRGLSDEEFDRLIAEGIMLRSEELLEAGMVDVLAPFADLDSIAEELEGRSLHREDRAGLLPYQEPGDDRWGAVPEVGLLYAVGPTQVESGIRARTLAREIRSFRDRPEMRALVLRVDSPGGDALASDLVARELRETAEEMPVIVSMGDLGTSGGYWISMHADSIVALPNTLTGSIGVIGGWLYDQGFGERLRLRTDDVQRGPSADAFFGPSLPLIGLQLPGRRLTEEEREHLVDNLLALYEDFITGVAEGRGLEPEEVREVAAGRVWTGEDALDAGLVDALGSLSEALRIAREAAGIPDEERFAIVEGPEPPLFRLPTLLRLLGVEEREQPDPMESYLRMIVEQRGEAMPVLPFEYLYLYYGSHNRD